jgi:hypothetical protein
MREEGTSVLAMAVFALDLESNDGLCDGVQGGEGGQLAGDDGLSDRVPARKKKENNVCNACFCVSGSLLVRREKRDIVVKEGSWRTVGGT